MNTYWTRVCTENSKWMLDVHPCKLGVHPCKHMINDAPL